MTSSKRDLLLFGALGLLTFGLYFILEVFWVGFAGLVLGRQITFDQQPEWMLRVKGFVDLLPWLAYAGLALFAIVRRRWRPLAAFAGAQLLSVFLLAGSLIAAPIVSDYATRIPFDSSTWKAENEKERTGVRVRMVDDLLRKHHLQGMTVAQIEDLLGVPPPTAYFTEYDHVYWLGPERGLFSIDSEWLAIKSEHGVVVNAKILTD